MIQYFPSGDSAFLLRFGTSISLETNQQIQAYVRLLKREAIKGVVEVVPAYSDLTIHYNPLRIAYQDLLGRLRALEKKANISADLHLKKIRIPVCYGGVFGPDMQQVAKHTNLSVETVIKKHCTSKYHVYMLGFTPGFCYLGGMDPDLATPRKVVPSLRIVAGSVGIAANQTGVYPIDSPGGWQIIGRTPLKFFNSKKENPFLIEAGAELAFYAISESEYYILNEHETWDE